MNDTVAQLIVCGNSDRRDDGAALRAVSRLLPTLSDEGRRWVEVTRCGQLDVEHLLDIPADVPVVIVDSAVGVPAGHVVSVPLDDLIDHPRGPAPRSSHALPINQVLGIRNVLSDAPLRGLFVGVGGVDFGFGDDLSAPVHTALPDFITAIDAAIDEVTRPLERPPVREPVHVP